MVSSRTVRTQNPIDNITGPTFNPTPRLATPPPPTGVSIKVYANGTWRVFWNDVRSRVINNENDNPVDAWRIGFTRDSVVGPQNSSPTWASDVRDKARVVGDIFSSGNAQQLNFYQGDTSDGDGWVTIWGIGPTGLLGKPSTPLRDLVSTTTGAIPGNILAASAFYFVNRINANDTSYGFYHDLRVTWKPPATTTEFGGMQLYISSYNGISTLLPQECGSMAVWDRTTGTAESRYKLPEDSGMGSGTATFTNGSAAVVRVSGSNFIVGMTFRNIVIYSGNVNDLSVVLQNNITVFTDANHVTMNNTFTGVTGTYSWRVYNAFTMNFVPVSLSGIRRTDPTAALTVNY